ncbi:hypothetical protein PVAG01_10126 [Phlyctema vagabunda]|uniref:Zn(2)-C6 fungal-type domain-containing protein n=1 Tax=Phlyctema vagabunda TaxID=108571 RepID=A0ABR4P529_9HELO
MLAEPPGDHPSPVQVTRKTRTRTGCLNCRRRRRKCDESRPSCLNCRQRGEGCEWGIRVTFRSGNATSLEAGHPSMLEGRRKRPRHYKIMNVTSQIEKNYQTRHSEESPVGSPTEESMSEVSTPLRPAEYDVPTQHGISSTMHLQAEDLPAAWQAESPSFYTPNSMSHSDGMPYSMDGDSLASPTSNGSRLQLVNSHASDYSDRAGLNPSFISEPGRISGASTTSPIHTEDAAAELLALRYMPSQPHPSLNSAHDINEQSEMPPPLFPGSLDNHNPLLDQHMFDDVDGIFLPGSAYQELHSTLRDHLIYTARSNAPTRSGTPDQHPDMGFFMKAPPKEGEVNNETEQDPESNRSSKPPELTPQREYVLWKTWINEVAPWLDKFDNKRHFEHQIPMIARTTPHLKNSLLALAARQIERKENSPSSSESLALYQEAIHLLLPELQSKNTAVIASCVILCVLEMMSCKY